MNLEDLYSSSGDDRFKRIKGKRERRQLLRSLLYMQSKGVCSVCRKPMNLAGVDIELVVPEERDGAVTWDNARVVHSYCTRDHLRKKYGDV
jgi:hypothetical protein